MALLLPRDDEPITDSPDGTRDLQGCSHVPGCEFFLTITIDLAFGSSARCSFENEAENLLSHLFHRCFAIRDLTAVDVHVLRHAAVHRRVGRELKARYRLAAEARTAPRGEADDVCPARDLTGNRDRIVTRGIQDHETLLGDRLRITINFNQVAGAAFGGRTQRFLENRGDAS